MARLAAAYSSLGVGARRARPVDDGQPAPSTGSRTSPSSTSAPSPSPSTPPPRRSRSPTSCGTAAHGSPSSRRRRPRAGSAWSTGWSSWKRTPRRTRRGRPSRRLRPGRGSPTAGWPVRRSGATRRPSSGRGVPCAAADPVTVVYTSGTTGDPKGVSSPTATSCSDGLSLDRFVELPDHAEHICYLPFAHIAERMLGIYLPVLRAAHVYLCADPAQVAATARELHPSQFFGVPRVWEKLAASVRAALARSPTEQRQAVETAGRRGARTRRAPRAGRGAVRGAGGLLRTSQARSPRPAAGRGGLRPSGVDGQRVRPDAHGRRPLLGGLRHRDHGRLGPDRDIGRGHGQQPGRVPARLGRQADRGRWSCARPPDGEIEVRGPTVFERLPAAATAPWTCADRRRGLVPHGRHRASRRGRLPLADRPQEGDDHHLDRARTSHPRWSRTP